MVINNGVATGLEVKQPGQSTEVKDYDAVIATTPSYVFTRLVPDIPEDYLDKLTKVDYLAAVVLILVLDRSLSNKYWLSVADDTLPFVGIIEHTNMIDRSLYGNKHIVYLTNYPTRDSELYAKSGEELLDEFLPQLKKINPDFEPSWVQEFHHHKVDGAQPVIGINYSQRIPQHRTPFKNLYLANTTQIYPEDRGTNYSVRMGREVAQMVLDDLGSP